ncbi:MAG: type II secretion system inner membrane protein GspF [Brachymonas sp.]|nr:type II secretion system inner membrane protein GspF [Brachymonas sp.]
MPAYRFEALDHDGQSRKGTIEADTARAARAALRQQQLVPMLVEPALAGDVSEGRSDRGLFTSRVFAPAALALWTRQLASLLVSGLSLDRALQALADESEIARQQQLVATIRAEVNAGSSFAKALQQHPREFSPVYTAVVAAGEHSGALGPVLDKLANDLEAQQELRSKLYAAALYPAIVTVLALLIVVFLVSYVVPQIATVFASSKRALPLLTRIMMGFSALVRHWGWLVLLLAGAAAVVWRQARKADPVRQRTDAFLLRVPLMGKLMRYYNAARFTGTLSLLVQAGVPILRALQAANETLANRAMQVDAEDALVLVREGAPLASALSQKKRFPGLVSMFARLGEQTGQLPIMLERAANQLNAQVQRRAMQLATILEPLLIVGMGVVVGMIVLAVLMPIIQLNQLVK